MNYIHNQDDFATEPIRGLPAALPAGEFVLWQGAPNWRAFARQVFHTRALAVLIALAAATRFGLALNAQASFSVALGEASVIALFGAIGIGILTMLAWFVQKTTVYTITNKRIVMRIGVALQKTFNLPFVTIEGAALSANKRDVGNISIALKPDLSLAYLLLWPHVRPWKMANCQPTLRAIPQASRVAKLLTEAYTSKIATTQALERSQKAAMSEESSDIPDATTQTAQQTFNDPPFIPKSMAMMAAATVVLTVITVGIAQWLDLGGQRSNQGTPIFEQALQFIEHDANHVSVVNAETGQEITMIGATGDGLLRTALRGMKASRNQADIDSSAPFFLQRFESDGVYLSDPLTERSVRLESFGPVEALGATADLVRLGYMETATSQ